MSLCRSLAAQESIGLLASQVIELNAMLLNDLSLDIDAPSGTLSQSLGDEAESNVWTRRLNGSQGPKKMLESRSFVSVLMRAAECFSFGKYSGTTKTAAIPQKLNPCQCVDPS